MLESTGVFHYLTCLLLAQRATAPHACARFLRHTSKKSDVRIYALVTSCAPPTVYLGEMGYRFVHLTNVAVQKTAHDYDPASGCKRELIFLKQYLISRHGEAAANGCLTHAVRGRGELHPAQCSSTATRWMSSGACIPFLHPPPRIRASLPSWTPCTRPVTAKGVSTPKTTKWWNTSFLRSLPFPPPPSVSPSPYPRFLVPPLPFPCPSLRPEAEQLSP